MIRRHFILISTIDKNEEYIHNIGSLFVFDLITLWSQSLRGIEKLQIDLRVKKKTKNNFIRSIFCYKQAYLYV